MAEKVEVVIKIPKCYLTHPQDYSCLAECVRRGTPLTKGHGDLVDYEELKNNAGEYGAYAEATLSHIKPKIIIESDKAESEGKE